MTSSSSQAAITNDMDFKLTITVTDNLVQSIRAALKYSALTQTFLNADCLLTYMLVFLELTVCVFARLCVCFFLSFFFS